MSEDADIAYAADQRQIMKLKKSSTSEQIAVRINILTRYLHGHED